MNEGITFVPGAYWTPERAHMSRERLRASVNTDATRELFRMIAEATAVSGDPAAASASFAPEGAPGPSSSAVVTRDTCVYRRGSPADIPVLATLIVSGELPPFFLEEIVDGFLVIEHDARLVGAGGVEFYGQDAVIRSVVVDPGARGLGLGIDIARLLEEDAFASGARDVYLFTLHAYRFWLKRGYSDLALDEWPANVRENWQYQFVAGYPEAARDVHAMVKRGSR
jgi:amino-acid N-acetyltransferase